MGSAHPIRVAVVGAGYWGPNLVRNLFAHRDTEVTWICDAAIDRAQRLSSTCPGARATSDFMNVLDDGDVDAVVVATPPETHAELSLAAIDAGKHVLVEKPLATTLGDAQRVVDAASRAGLTLMCDHTYCYTPAVRKIRELVDDGRLGNIQYFDSVRINLGLIQSRVNVLWDLAPHDLSILDFVLPQSSRPVQVSAHVADPLGVGQACIGYLTLPLRNGGIAHVHVNWMSPTKIRRTVIAGSRQMLVWDDLEPSQRLSVYDKGVDMDESLDEAERKQLLISYRVGDMVAPALPEREALANVVDDFVTGIRTGNPPPTDGHAGLRVVEILTAAQQSIADRGRLVAIGGHE